MKITFTFMSIFIYYYCYCYYYFFYEIEKSFYLHHCSSARTHLCTRRGDVAQCHSTDARQDDELQVYSILGCEGCLIIILVLSITRH